MLQPAPCVWLYAEWQISKRMCVRLQVWWTVSESKSVSVHICQCTFSFLHASCHSVLSVFLSHTARHRSSTHSPLTHSWTHPLHSSSKGELYLYSYRHPEDTHTHITRLPFHTALLHRIHTLSLFFTLLKKHSFNPPPPVGSLASYWLTHKQLTAYVFRTCASRNICCCNRFHFISVTFSLLSLDAGRVCIFSIPTSTQPQQVLTVIL